MKLKNFMIESEYFMGMLVALLLTVRSCAAYAQSALYSCAVLHEHGRICIIPLDNFTLEIIPPSDFASDGDSVAFFRLINSPNDSVVVFGWITDSIKLVVTDTTFEGDCKCEHSWVYDSIQKGNIGIHRLPALGDDYYATYWCEWGKHCNEHQSATREKICRNCLRSVIEREKWYQRFVAPPKSAFELLKEKQRAKQ